MAYRPTDEDPQEIGDEEIRRPQPTGALIQQGNLQQAPDAAPTPTVEVDAFATGASPQDDTEQEAGTDAIPAPIAPRVAQPRVIGPANPQVAAVASQPDAYQAQAIEEPRIYHRRYTDPRAEAAQQARDQRIGQQEQARLQREEDQRAAKVARGLKSQGVEMETDLETGAQSPKLDTDGNPIYKPGQLSPVQQNAEGKWVKTQRDRQGNEVEIEVAPKTDPATGEKYIEDGGIRQSLGTDKSFLLRKDVTLTGQQLSMAKQQAAALEKQRKDGLKEVEDLRLQKYQVTVDKSLSDVDRRVKLGVLEKRIKTLADQDKPLREQAEAIKTQVPELQTAYTAKRQAAIDEARASLGLAPTPRTDMAATAPAVGADGQPVKPDGAQVDPKAVSATMDKIEQAPLTAFDKLKDVGANPEQLVPFLGTGVELYQIGQIALAANRLRAAANDGTVPDQEDLKLVKEWQERNSRDTTFGYKVASVVAALPAFAGELAATGGVYTAAEKSALLAGKKTLEYFGKAEGARLLGVLAKRAAAKAAGKSVPEVVTKTGVGMASEFAARGAASAAASAVQLIPAGGLRIAVDAVDRMLPKMNFSESEKGMLAATLDKEGDDFGPALAKAFGNQYTEVMSERTGGALAFVPGASKLKALKASIAQKWFDATPGARPGAFKKLLAKAGWNGVLGEMFEERVGDVTKSAMGLQSWADAVPSLEQLAVEGVGFAIPGAAIGAVNLARNRKGKQAGEAAPDQSQTAQASADGSIPEGGQAFPAAEAGAPSSVTSGQVGEASPEDNDLLADLNAAIGEEQTASAADLQQQADALETQINDPAIAPEAKAELIRQQQEVQRELAETPPVESASGTDGSVGSESGTPLANTPQSGQPGETPGAAISEGNPSSAAQSVPRSAATSQSQPGSLQAGNTEATSLQQAGQSSPLLSGEAQPSVGAEASQVAGQPQASSPSDTGKSGAGSAQSGSAEAAQAQGSTGVTSPEATPATGDQQELSDEDEAHYAAAEKIARGQGGVSVNALKERLKLGHTRAEHIFETLKQRGVVGANGRLSKNENTTDSTTESSSPGRVQERRPTDPAEGVQEEGQGQVPAAGAEGADAGTAGQELAPAEEVADTEAAPASDSRSVAMLDIEGSAREKILAIGRKIDPADLYTAEEGYGLEEEPHITALYGLDTQDPAPVQEVLKRMGPIKARLGKVSLFENEDKPYDVVKIDVAGAEIHALNADLKKLPFKSDFPDYHPHVTIAYVKKGRGQKYVGGTAVTGQEITLDSATFSNASREKTRVSMKGEEAPAPAAQDQPASEATPAPKSAKGLLQKLLFAGKAKKTLDAMGVTIRRPAEGEPRGMSAEFEKDGALYLNVDDAALEQRLEGKEDREGVIYTFLQHEITHLAGLISVRDQWTARYKSNPVNGNQESFSAAAKREGETIFGAMTEEQRKFSRSTYGDPGAQDWQIGFEFIRQLYEAETGGTPTEALMLKADQGVIRAYIQRILATLKRFLDNKATWSQPLQYAYDQTKAVLARATDQSGESEPRPGGRAEVVAPPQTPSESTSIPAPARAESTSPQAIPAPAQASGDPSAKTNTRKGQPKQQKGKGSPAAEESGVTSPKATTSTKSTASDALKEQGRKALEGLFLPSAVQESERQELSEENKRRFRNAFSAPAYHGHKSGDAKAALDGLDVTLTARMVDTGESTTHTMPAAEAITSLRRSREGLKALSECLSA